VTADQGLPPRPGEQRPGQIGKKGGGVPKERPLEKPIELPGPQPPEEKPKKGPIPEPTI